MTKLKNTMSDRHAAEKLFNEILHEFRADILPTVAENWDQMTEMEKEQLTHRTTFSVGFTFLLDWLILLKWLNCEKPIPHPKKHLLHLALRGLFVLHAKPFIIEVPNSVVVLHYFVPT